MARRALRETLLEDLIGHVRKARDGTGHPLDLADVDVVAAHAHAVRLAALRRLVALSHDVITLHPPRLSDMELVRPAVRVGELVAAQAIAAHSLWMAAGTALSRPRK